MHVEGRFVSNSAREILSSATCSAVWRPPGTARRVPFWPPALSDSVSLRMQGGVGHGRFFTRCGPSRLAHHSGILRHSAAARAYLGFDAFSFGTGAPSGSQ